ncbi:plastocyanin/azurin family copper-binding protein [Massilia sp. TWP1-3-3]|uniref:plastocyanin/azurin family copper-binding protein n=1 Tax=Massilia sp. TWP1-3-3 TaxID=2804573 RepID=UPI003CF498E3
MNAMSAAAALLATLAILHGQTATAGQARTVDIGMYDSMRFAPGELSVEHGETIRFIVRNQGKVQHEIVIGTRDDIANRRQSGHHGHGAGSAMLHVAPGASEQFLWQAELSGELEYACLLPGHYEAGMRGTILVLPNP